MKKIFLIFGLFFVFGCGTYVFAEDNVCSKNSSDMTIEKSLYNKDLAIFIVQPDSKGARVKAKTILGNENSPLEVIVFQDDKSCSTRTDVFFPDEFILVLSPIKKTLINHYDNDDQFSFAFKNKTDAFDKYNEYYKVWESKKDILENFNLSEDSYIPSGNTLRPGMENNDVKKLQEVLQKRLSLQDFKIDGSYGPATTAAVKQFQELVGLEVDGLAGKKTQEKLITLNKDDHVNDIIENDVTSENNNETKEKTLKDEVVSYSYIPSGNTLRPGMENNDVKKLQEVLQKRLSLQDFKIDGSYGPATTAAVKQFQELVGLEVDGLAGKKTQEKLKSFFDNEVEKKDNTLIANNQISELNTKTPIEETKKTFFDGDLVNSNLVEALKRAHQAIENNTTGLKNYVDAYSIVVQYNNEFLDLYSKSDPLYKSLDGGNHFIYFVKNVDGQYICIDDTNDSISIHTEMPGKNNFSC